MPKKQQTFLTVRIKLNSINAIKDFVLVNSNFKEDIDVSINHYVVDGKSIIGLFSLDTSKEVVVLFKSFDDSEKAEYEKQVRNIKDLLFLS